MPRGVLPRPVGRAAHPNQVTWGSEQIRRCLMKDVSCRLCVNHVAKAWNVAFDACDPSLVLLKLRISSKNVTGPVFSIFALPMLFWGKTPTRPSKKLSRNLKLLQKTRDRDLVGVENLLQQGANINCEAGNIDDREGRQTPLSIAVTVGHEQMVRKLLENDADIQWQDEGSRTPLSLAAKNNYATIVGLLLDKKANFETRDCNGQTPLSVAAQKGHSEVVGVLLEKKADPDAHGPLSRTPLSLVAEKGRSLGHREVAQLLLEKEAKIEEQCSGQTPLSWAAANGNQQIVQLLLEKKAETQTENWVSETPFDLAKGNGHDEVATLLLAHECKGDWTVERLCWLINKHNQDVVVGTLKMWPKPAKQSDGETRNYMKSAKLGQRLRQVLAPIDKAPSDETCAAIIDSSYVENLSKDDCFCCFWAPQVAVVLKVLPGVRGTDAINKEFLWALVHTPHERIFETDAIQAMILAAWEQEWLWTRLEILSCATMVISLCVSSYGFRHSSLTLAGTSLWVAAILHGKKSLNELVQLVVHFGKKCIHWFNFDNFADLIYIVSGWAAIILRQWSDPWGLEKPCMAMFCALSWLRLLYCLRGETWMGPKLLPILSAIKDTVAFFVLMTICIAAASHAYYNLELRPEPWPTYAAIMQIVRLGIFADFDMFEFEGLDKTYIPKDADNASVFEPKDPDPGKQYPWAHALFYFTGLGITVLLMNVLISILSENYGRYAEKATGQFFRARVNILVELQDRPLRRLWWACQRKKKYRRQNCMSIAQCPKGEPAIFFVVRDEPDIDGVQSLGMELQKQLGLLDTRMQTVDKTVGSMHSNMERLLESRFKQMTDQMFAHIHINQFS